MFKNLKIITCALLAALSLAACGEPKETPEEAAVRALDFDALTHQVVAEITNTTNFPMAYDVYDLEIAVAPLSQSDNQDNWYIHDFVSAGMHTKQPIELLG